MCTISAFVVFAGRAMLNANAARQYAVVLFIGVRL
jgi:hypothetical protein